MTYSIGEVVQRTGMSVHTLRFYEREGLLAGDVSRDGAGRRRYSEWDLEWLDICQRLQTTGMPLAAIREYAELVRRGDGTELDRLRLLREHQERVTQRIEELKTSLTVISNKVSAYEEHLLKN